MPVNLLLVGARRCTSYGCQQVNHRSYLLNFFLSRCCISSEASVPARGFGGGGGGSHKRPQHANASGGCSPAPAPPPPTPPPPAAHAPGLRPSASSRESAVTTTAPAENQIGGGSEEIIRPMDCRAARWPRTRTSDNGDGRRVHAARGAGCELQQLYRSHCCLGGQKGAACGLAAWAGRHRHGPGGPDDEGAGGDHGYDAAEMK